MTTISFDDRKPNLNILPLLFVFFLGCGGSDTRKAPPGAGVYSVPTYTTVVYSGTTEYLYVNGTYYVPTTKPAEQPPQAQ